ncbi:general transcription factor IIF subunit 2-like isoform X1 [Branchiostoma lanceolatum]|uniref:general transcription factor IIF subunit 2-like isoform X1 n=1 Tax=Branchiostoma lanceolatum TaxID=7740 RepID=UPI003455A2C3
MAKKSSDLDCKGSSNNLWLVKVPKYMSNKWMTVEDGEVGTLKINRRPGAPKPEVIFSLKEELAQKDDGKGSSEAPREHKFVLSGTAGQPMGVFSQTSAVSAPRKPRKEFTPDVLPRHHKLVFSGVNNQSIMVFSQTRRADEAGSSSNGALSLEGKVAHRVDCRPVGGENYMKLKKLQVLDAMTPVRTTMQLHRAVTNNYKPVSNHANNLEVERRKKEDGKRSRADPEKVQEMLFSAFEKHQYYNIKDLVEITKQPIQYLKEVLKEIATYNLKAPHKNTWELKPEYRHYKGGETPMEQS